MRVVIQAAAGIPDLVFYCDSLYTCFSGGAENKSVGEVLGACFLPFVDELDLETIKYGVQAAGTSLPMSHSPMIAPVPLRGKFYHTKSEIGRAHV